MMQIYDDILSRSYQYEGIPHFSIKKSFISLLNRGGIVVYKIIWVPFNFKSNTYES